MNEEPTRIRLLHVEIDGPPSGQLLQQSGFEYRYLKTDSSQPVVGLLMPPSNLTWKDGDLFPVMDQNLPEGDLFNRLRQHFPKQAMTAMRLLAMIGKNGIGRLGFTVPDGPPPLGAAPISRETLLNTPFSEQLFDDLVAAYLSTGIGVAGMQPKIMVPDRATVPIPNLIVKTAGEIYPGLAANEYLCMKAATRAGIETAQVELSHDGQMLLVDRFDLGSAGERYGFEDVASLMGLRVRDTLSERKYHGSYQKIAELLGMITGSREDLQRFFEQLAFSVMVGNGDAHLKNFGVLYQGVADNIRLSPMFDVVTTRIYRYQRSPGGPELQDNTLALRLFSGKSGRSKAYPLPEELIHFGRKICLVPKPSEVLERIAQGMVETLQLAHTDERIPSDLLSKISRIWQAGIGYA